jgi:hypothetical protein
MEALGPGTSIYETARIFWLQIDLQGPITRPRWSVPQPFSGLFPGFCVQGRSFDRLRSFGLCGRFDSVRRRSLFSPVLSLVKALSEKFVVCQASKK